MIKKYLKTLIGGLSFTTACFVFQACYGTPQDLLEDVLIEGKVSAFKTGIPVKGIKITILNDSQYSTSDENGSFSFYTLPKEKYSLRFEDMDGTTNGSFLTNDTILSNVSKQIFINVKMKEK